MVANIRYHDWSDFNFDLIKWHAIQFVSIQQVLKFGNRESTSTATDFEPAPVRHEQ